MDPDQEKIINILNNISESCPFRGVMTAGMGFVGGAAFGVIMSSFEFSNYSLPDDKPPPTLRQQMKEALRDTGKRSFSMAKNFAAVGALFATTECFIESYRAKHDLVNSAAAGCISGGLLAVKAGPQAAAIGCASFAAFSTAIDYFIEH